MSQVEENNKNKPEKQVLKIDAPLGVLRTPSGIKYERMSLNPVSFYPLLC